MLDRSSVIVDRSAAAAGLPGGGAIEARFTVALPARGRSICGEWAAQIFIETLPRLVHEALLHESTDHSALMAHLCSVEDQQAARSQLAWPRTGRGAASGSLPRTF